MSRQSELAELSRVYDSSALSNRNLMHNPKMEIAQRGTSFSYSSGQSAQLLDRWYVPIGSSYDFDTTISQSTTVPTGEGFKYSLKVEMDAADTPSGSENGGIGMKFEGQDFNQLDYGTSSAKSLTLSFWVRSNKTGVYCCQIHTNAADSTTGNKYQQVKEYTISVANTWEKKTLTFSGLTTQAITQTNTDGFRMLWWLSVGPDDRVATADTWTQSQSYLSTSNQVNFADSASNEWYLTGCQLEVGTEATPFEHRSFGQELALCQRYCQVLDPKVAYAQYNFVGFCESSTKVKATYSFPTVMRAAPTQTRSGNFLYDGATANPTISSLYGSSITNYCCRSEDTVSSGNTGEGVILINNNDATAKITFDAEL